jgi:hypothetical protein
MGRLDKFGFAAALAAVGISVGGKLYTATEIERHIRRHGRSRQMGHSIADQPHEHARANARRVRQAARDRENRACRLVAESNRAGHTVRPPDVTGLSRRGRALYS